MFVYDLSIWKPIRFVRVIITKLFCNQSCSTKYVLVLKNIIKELLRGRGNKFNLTTLR